MTPQDIMDAANADVKNLGRITQAEAITWFAQANNEIPEGAVVSSITIALTASTRNYSLATATGFLKVLEMRDDDDEPYNYTYRIRTISSVKTLCFSDDPYEAQTITAYFAKRPTAVSASNFDSLTMEIDTDHHDLYVHFLKAKFYEKMLETDSQAMSKADFLRRLGDLSGAVNNRWHEGQPDTVKAVW